MSDPTFTARTGRGHPRRPVTGEIIFGAPRKVRPRKTRKGSPEAFRGGLLHATLDDPPAPDEVKRFFGEQCEALVRVGLTRERRNSATRHTGRVACN